MGGSWLLRNSPLCSPSCVWERPRPQKALVLGKAFWEPSFGEVGAGFGLPARLGPVLAGQQHVPAVISAARP